VRSGATKQCPLMIASLLLTAALSPIRRVRATAC
jgi:hypothetical protein